MYKSARVHPGIQMGTYSNVSHTVYNYQHFVYPGPYECDIPTIKHKLHIIVEQDIQMKTHIQPSVIVEMYFLV